MAEKIRAFARTYREQLAYLVVGCLTTLINYAVFALTSAVNIYYLVGNVIAWIVAVLFSYFANGKWVYRSTAQRGLKEFVSFVLSRLFSLGLETLVLMLLVSVLKVNQMIAKLLVAVLVVIVNYLTGLLVFKHKKGA